MALLPEAVYGGPPFGRVLCGVSEPGEVRVGRGEIIRFVPGDPDAPDRQHANGGEHEQVGDEQPVESGLLFAGILHGLILRGWPTDQPTVLSIDG